MKMSISFELEEMRALQEVLEETAQWQDADNIVVALTARVKDTLEVFERWAPKDRGNDEE